MTSKKIGFIGLGLIGGSIAKAIRQYYPDFLAKMTDGSYQLIEVKGDTKIDDTVVKAKQTAAEEMAVASGIKYLMYAGSQIMSSHILDDSESVYPRTISCQQS